MHLLILFVGLNRLYIIVHHKSIVKINKYEINCSLIIPKKMRRGVKDSYTKQLKGSICFDDKKLKEKLKKTSSESYNHLDIPDEEDK